MGLAVSNIRWLTLTSRKADVENSMTSASLHKQSLLREMSDLSRQYQSKLSAKQISYYADGKYNPMSYEYLMGYADSDGDADYTGILKNAGLATDGEALTECNNLVLTDYKGRVVLNEWYVNAIKNSGVQVNDNGTFDTTNESIAKILAAMEVPIENCPSNIIEKTLNGEEITDEDYEEYKEACKASKKPLNLQPGRTGDGSSCWQNTTAFKTTLSAIIEFYVSKIKAAGANGFTTAYNSEIQNNEDYVSDSLISGTFQLMQVDDSGSYEANSTLTYFVNMGYVDENSSSDAREEVTAWYNAEKDNLTEKETYWDMEISNLSTELESIKTEMDSLKSFIDDAISSVFDWGSA